MGKVLGLNTKLVLLGKWSMSSPVVRMALFASFSSFVCPIAGLLCSMAKSQIVGTAYFLKYFDEA